ncbi:MAG: acyl-CoA thioesterase [Desulfobulbus sp.]|jgi:acyl-CoA thioesterase YciA
MHHVTSKICRASEIGYNGNLFGGTMLSWLDEAGAAFAGYICRTPNLVTLKMNEVHFQKPVKISDHIHIHAKVHALGRTSITVNVEAQRFDFVNGIWELVCSTQIIYVKIDEQGRPTPMDPCVATGCPLGEPLPQRA